MKWFQHSTDSYNDPDISDAEDLFGDAGYSVFFKILEIYGREFNSINPDGFLNISKTFVRRKCRKSWTKVEQILNFYQTKNRIYYENDKDMISFCIPKFLKQSDNWTKRTKKEEPPKLQSGSVVTTAIEIEEEIEKNNTKEKNKDDFHFKKLVSIPDNIFLTDRMEKYVLAKNPTASNHATVLFEKFQNHHAAKGSKFKDWARAFYTWVGNDKEYHPDNYKKKQIEIKTPKTWFGKTDKEREEFRSGG